MEKESSLAFILIASLLCCCLGGAPEDTGFIGNATLAEAFVGNLSVYEERNGKNILLIEYSNGSSCPDCWDFLYEFDLEAEDDYDFIERGMVRLTVRDALVIRSSFSSTDKEELYSLSDLFASPIYGIRVELGGTASVPEEDLGCPCILFSSEGSASALLQYDGMADGDWTRPAIDVSRIKDGDRIVVVGELREEKINGTPLMWASRIRKGL